MKLATLVALIALVGGAEANAAQTFKCKTLDGIKVGDGGTFEKLTDNEQRFWFGAYKALVIDTLSGAVKIGDGQTRNWVIEQTKVDGDWDFVANSAKPIEPLRIAADTVRLRVGRGEPVTFVYVYNGFMFFTGTCEDIY